LTRGKNTCNENKEHLKMSKKRIVVEFEEKKGFYCCAFSSEKKLQNYLKLNPELDFSRLDEYS